MRYIGDSTIHPWITASWQMPTKWLPPEKLFSEQSPPKTIAPGQLLPYVNLFSIKIDLLPFSLATRETSAMLGGNVLILDYLFISTHFLVLVC